MDSVKICTRADTFKPARAYKLLIHSFFSIVILRIARKIHSLCQVLPCSCWDTPSNPQQYIRPSLWSWATLFIVLFQYSGYFVILSTPILFNPFEKFYKIGHTSYLDFLRNLRPLSQSKHNQKLIDIVRP